RPAGLRPALDPGGNRPARHRLEPPVPRRAAEPADAPDVEFHRPALPRPPQGRPPARGRPRRRRGGPGEGLTRSRREEERAMDTAPRRRRFWQAALVGSVIVQGLVVAFLCTAAPRPHPAAGLPPDDPQAPQAGRPGGLPPPSSVAVPEFEAKLFAFLNG